jgi:hypothetical protein
MREIVRVVLISSHHPSDNYLPRDERDIRIGKLVAHEPWPVTVSIHFLPSQMLLQDACDSIDFFGTLLSE